MGRSDVSSSSRNFAERPATTPAPACIFLFTSNVWPPLPSEKNVVRKGKPFISPRTLIRPRVFQTLAASNGMRMITHPSPEWSRSRIALNDFVVDFVIRYVHSREICIMSHREHFLPRRKNTSISYSSLNLLPRFPAEYLELTILAK